MKCHYEVLNIDRNADETEIKTAYRKLALKWHPDKNIDNPDLAKEQFQLVQQAYEVLSDRQERAWYDNHREQILKGASNSSNYKDNSLDVFQYFTSSCFNGYNDDENGFYSVYRKVFEQIASEDIEYMDDECEFDQIPKFGDSTSDYDSVVGPFYAYWMSYSTRKTYVWLDPYDIRETRDRRVLKLIEKENKKVRIKAKKERNEEIRNLVAFVRKRDKRVQAHQKFLTERNAENRKKNEELRKQKVLQRKQQINSAKENEQEWSKFENMSHELEAIEMQMAAEFGEVLSDSSDNCDNNLYCVACNKIFKTVNAFDNHETSKKHLQNVEFLKQQMIDETGEIVSDEEEHLSLDDDDDEAIKPQKLKKDKKKKVSKLPSESSDDGILDLGLSKKQRKKNLREQQILSTLKDNSIQDDEIETNSKKKTKSSNINKTNGVDLTHCCAVCKTNFTSKNKLFDHLKKSGHSVALTDTQSIIENKRKKKHK